jgi:hypothetical protein
LGIELQQVRRENTGIQDHEINRTPKIRLYGGKVCSGRIAVCLSGLGHQITHIDTSGRAGRYGLTHTLMHKDGYRPGEQGARTQHQEVGLRNRLEHCSLGSDRGLQEELRNRRARLPLHDFPFANNLLSVGEDRPNLRIAIRHRQDPMLQSGSRTDLGHRSVQALVLAREGGQDEVAYAQAAQLPCGKPIAEELSPYRVSVYQGTEALARVSHLRQT